VLALVFFQGFGQLMGGVQAVEEHAAESLNGGRTIVRKTAAQVGAGPHPKKSRSIGVERLLVCPAACGAVG
jgi:hypothetical protein